MSQAVLDQLKQLATQLSRSERARLAEWLATPGDDQSADSSPRPAYSLYGACADLGSAPTDADIDEARGEMWGDFPRRESTVLCWNRDHTDCRQRSRFHATEARR